MTAPMTVPMTAPTSLAHRLAAGPGDDLSLAFSPR